MNIIAIKGLFHTQTKAKDSNVPIGKIPDQTILLLIEGMTGSHQFIAEIALPKTVAVVVPTAAPNLLIGSKSGLSVGTEFTSAHPHSFRRLHLDATFALLHTLRPSTGQHQ